MNLASLVVTIGEGQVGPPFSAPPRQTERDDFLGGLSRARSKYVALLVAFAVSAASSSAEAADRTDTEAPPPPQPPSGVGPLIAGGILTGMGPLLMLSSIPICAKSLKSSSW
jgi:hypothetical protein